MRPSPWLLCVALLIAGCAARTPTTAGTRGAAAEPRIGPEVLVRRPPRSSGLLDGDIVGRRLHRDRERLAACYRDIGWGHRAGRGVVYALLDVDSDGDVRRVTIGHTDVRDRRFEACLEETIRAMAFPATGEGSVVQAHLVFGAESEAEGRAMLAAYRSSRGGSAPDGEPMDLAGLRGRIQPCYERALRRRPDLRGRTVLHLVLDEDGSVADAAFSSGDGVGDGLGRCVLGVVRNLRFRMEAAEVATLTYPVILEPGMR